MHRTQLVFHIPSKSDSWMFYAEGSPEHRIAGIGEGQSPWQMLCIQPPSSRNNHNPRKSPGICQEVTFLVRCDKHIFPADRNYLDSVGTSTTSSAKSDLVELILVGRSFSTASTTETAFPNESLDMLGSGVIYAEEHSGVIISQGRCFYMLHMSMSIA